ncbi:MAG: sigma-54-dependent Fis family transcriptional regulator [Acidobacteria bacterium]|nr:sigma-54-dependent Fis family transcriptional regulator [Acidobacteriota bacterium]
MTSVLYLGCPAAERASVEAQFAAERLSVVWADSVHFLLTELQDREMPVILDLSRGAATLQVARELLRRRTDALMFAVVDPRRPDLTTEAVLAGVADVFARPLGGRRVANAIARELAYESAGGGAGPPAAIGADLYALSPAMRDVAALVARAAAMRAGVTIRGEEGTGRQTIARAIHAQQAAGDFVCLDCGAHEFEKLEIELFGTSGRVHAADRSSPGLERISAAGRLHAARGGTLFVQNVAEAPARIQARLARVLRDREALSAESGETIDLDVRPMAAVDAAFDRAVAEGRVRDDLHRRLSVLSIDVPPLRQRREDIPALANHFIREVCAALGLPPKTLSRPALSLLGALPWRGNAVELRALLEGIVRGQTGGRGIGLDDVLAHVRLDGSAGVLAHGGTLRQARARFERDYIVAVLDQHRGRISDAAKALGIQRTNLYRKMRSLRLGRNR